ncbi:hypothetical protein M3589_24090 [Heyndrickxia oleronia]|uniref:hypothetical protein n=1 Tax=Heyndrickxia oleronia TaxID=38875 RepID=UPI002040D49E|nr:hypothetical protein [Heyndrickxia oleronia]MCM3240740.1 hypothetical protein [Heyndrickxia oleronia]
MVFYNDHFSQKNIKEIYHIVELLIPLADENSIVYKTSLININSILDEYSESILLVEIDVQVKAIYIYMSSGVGIKCMLPHGVNDVFCCGLFKYIGMKCLYSWPGKDNGVLPF